MKFVYFRKDDAEENGCGIIFVCCGHYAQRAVLIDTPEITGVLASCTFCKKHRWIKEEVVQYVLGTDDLWVYSKEEQEA